MTGVIAEVAVDVVVDVDVEVADRGVAVVEVGVVDVVVVVCCVAASAGGAKNCADLFLDGAAVLDVLHHVEVPSGATFCTLIGTVAGRLADVRGRGRR